MPNYESPQPPSEPDKDPNRRRTQILKRVTLPSGKQVDVVSFIGKNTVEPQTGPTAHQPLCICPECRHDRVQPTSWNEVGSSHWHVHLRCPDCENRREAIFAQDELDEFDVNLDESTRAVAADLDLLSRANMADDIDRFCKGLKAGHIMPVDIGHAVAKPVWDEPPYNER